MQNITKFILLLDQDSESYSWARVNEREGKIQIFV